MQDRATAVQASAKLPAAEQPQRFFFGWAVVGFTFAAQFLTVGTLFYAYTALLKPLAEALDADRLEISLAHTVQSAVAALLGPWVGKLVAERSVRMLMIMGATLLLLGFLAMAQARNIWHLYLSYGLVLGVAMALTGPIPNNTLLANWFSRRRGTAMGISGVGISISGTLLVPLIAWLIEEHGWRVAVTSLGIGAFSILVPLALFFAVKHPEDRGLLPDNAAPRQVRDNHGLPEDPEGASYWTLGRVLRDRRIWHLVVIGGTSFLSIGGVLMVLYSHMTDIGLSPLRAASMMSISTGFAALAKPLFGILVDHINKRLTIAISLLCQIAGMSLFLAFESQAGLALAAVIFGLGYGAVMPVWSVVLAAMFGRGAFARILGAISPLTTAFMLAGLPFANYVYETTGSYRPAFAVLIGGLFVSLAALAYLRLPEEKKAD